MYGYSHALKILQNFIFCHILLANLYNMRYSKEKYSNPWRTDMAEMTNEEFKEKIKKYETGKPLEGDDLNLILQRLGTIENFDGFDAETLEKGSLLVRDLKLPDTLKDSLHGKIVLQIKILILNKIIILVKSLSKHLL